MSIFRWDYELDPDFPFTVMEYTAPLKDDRIHWHHYLEIAMCVEGEASFEFSQKKYDVQPGDIFIVNNFENHTVYSHESKEAHFVLLLFLPEMVAPLTGRSFEREYLRTFVYDPDTFNHRIQGNTEIAARLHKGIEQMHSVWKEQPQDYRNMIDVGLRQVLYLLMRHYDRNDAYIHETENSRQKIKSSLDYIRDNFRKPVKITELATMEHMSESSYRAAFHTAMHMQFKDYIHLLRITYAKQLLIHSDYCVAKVALESGYTNMNQFYKIFSKLVGLSPYYYRKSEQEALNIRKG